MAKIYLNAGNANHVDPVIARLSNGNLVIAFSNGSYQDGRIYFYLLDSKGNVTSDLKTVTSSTQFSFTEPRITVTPDNTFLISYQYATDSSIFTSKYSSSGVLLSSTNYARQAGTILELNSDLTTYDTDTTLLLYEIRTGSGDYEIGGRFLDRLGNILSTTPAFIVNQNSLGNQTSPDATLLANGNFSIVWRENSGVKLKLIDYKNNTVKSDISIFNGVQVDTIHTSRSDYGFGISYIRSSDRSIFFTFFNNNVEQQFEPVKVNSSGSSHSDLAITQLLGNTFVISWISGSTLYTREISSIGILGSEKIISVSALDTPSLVALTDDNYAIAWTEFDGTGNGIYYEIISRQPTYQITASSSAVNEGSSATFTLTTTNVVSGTLVPYTLSGISSADVSGGSLSGNAVVNSSGVATISVSLLKDSLTEGSEILTLTAGGANASTVVTDTSLTPTYFLTTGVNNVAEGNTVTFSLQTTNISSGTTLPYQISGVSAADIVGGNLSGSVLVSSPYLNESSSGIISIQLAADLFTEGREFLTVIVGNSSSTVAVEDTSVTPIYEIYAGNASYNEGQTAEFVFSAKNISAFTSLTYAISGVSSSDISNGTLSGTIQFSSGSYGYTFYIPLINDELTEGDETLTVSLGGVSASAVIKDTSQALVSYQLNGYSTSVNEGSFAQFTLYTKNVAIGTTINYTLAGVGITGSDIVGGGLSGTAVVASASFNGFTGGATININIAADNFTEGAESLEVYSQGQSANIRIRDTSTTLVPTYRLQSLTGGSVNEGTTATFTLSTTNVASGTLVPYTLSGISAADVSGGSLSGNAVVNSSGVATISVSLLNDSLTEGTETLTVSVNEALSSTLVYDTSLTPTYKLTALTTQVNESVVVSNDPVTLTRTAIQVVDKIGVDDPVNMFAGVTKWYVDPANGRNLPVIGEIYEGDIAFFYIPAVDPEGSTLSFSIQDRGSTGGDDSDASLFTMIAGTNSFKFTTPPDFENPRDKKLLNNQDPNDIISGAADNVYAIEAFASGYGTHYAIIVKNVNEPTDLSNFPIVASFSLTTTNIPSGTILTYTLSGVDSTDITNGQLSGTTTVDSNGAAVIQIPISADNKTEGDETLTLTVQGKTASTLVNDTSKAAATYSLTASSAFIDEGSVATFSLTTTSVNPGTSISYTISGVSTSDITGGLSGTATVDTNGLATISVPIAADFLTEGTETLIVTAQGKSATVIINDTSKAALVASYALSASTNSVAEGSNAVFTLTTTNVAAGTSVPYTISGLSATDITGGAATGNAIVSSSGTATITIPIAADLTTEGTETLTVTAQQVSSSILITDTSITPVTVTQPNTTVTSIPYGSGQYFVPTTGADRVTGTSYIDVVKQSSSVSANQIIKLSDGSWQIQNKLTPTNTDTLVNVERIDFTDYSVALDVNGSAGQVAKILGSVFGATYVKNPTFTGIGLAYLDSGMAYKDLAKLAADVAGLKTPDAIVSALWKNVIGSSATEANKAPYIKLLNEGMSVGDLVVLASDASINLQSINFSEISTAGLTYIPSTVPTVTATPTYSLVSNQATVNEGSSATFTLTTTNVTSGTALTYSLSGVSSNDLTSGSLSGIVTIGSNGVATITIPITADNFTEGSESLTVIVQGATASTVIADSSTTPKPTYSLIPAATSVNEGELARVFVNTTNVVAGTLLDYSVTGVSSNDIIGGLTRQVSVDALGQGFINLLTVADQATEGPETMYITLGTSTTSFIINDTSVTLIGVVDSGGGDGGGSGGGGGAGGD